jgi:hypothetical protein
MYYLITCDPASVNPNPLYALWGAVSAPSYSSASRYSLRRDHLPDAQRAQLTRRTTSDSGRRKFMADSLIVSLICQVCASRPGIV